MRNCFLLLFLFIATTVTAQHADTSNAPAVLKQLPTEGVVLSSGWRFQSGDNPAYAAPAYDDRNWQPIDPTKDIHDVPQIWKGIGWFRLKINLDSTVQSQPLAIAVQQSGASEIYINGKLLHRYGNISSQPEKIVAYDPWHKSLPLQFTKSGENVLAIRYSLQPHVFYTRLFSRPNPAFLISINNLETADDLYRRDSMNSGGTNMLWIGIYLILLFLHSAFYLYYPAQKANLYFALYALLSLAGRFIGDPISHEVKYIFYQLNSVADIGQLNIFFLLTALYFLLNQKRGWLFWSLLVLIIVGFVLNAVLYSLGFAISAFIINTLTNLEIVRIAFKGVKNKQRGASLIAIGSINFFIFWCLFLYVVLSGTLSNRLSETYNIGDLLFAIAFLSIPVATSIYLALDFAFTSRSLQQKLAEVERLSQEKQQILASQKKVLEQQVTERTAQLNKSLEDLKATQAQLVQREKLASLGELTSGIAHEIQNPLNFVNNFSETNVELIEEAQTELKTGNHDEASSILNDIKENEQKIIAHGKRADSIVKGMLQHSRATTGEKEPTDINALVDEYLRLAYHGIRAKDKEFNAQCETYLDSTIGKVSVVPQDIGRVLLNLFNNGFYATAEKKKKLNGAYQPVVMVRTNHTNGMVEIRVTDNGTGIPQWVIDKIFQPFFTTKPTGEGTGLGLSLSYDIIKVHGGELLVESEEGQSTTFMVRLPA